MMLENHAFLKMPGHKEKKIIKIRSAGEEREL